MNTSGGLKAEALGFAVPGRMIFEQVSFAVAGGQCISIMGPSGSGKTSLLHCLAGIVRPSSGSIFIDGQEITGRSVRERAAIRLKHLGLVYQFGDLLAELRVIENVALPLRLQGVSRADAEVSAAEILGEVGLGDRLNDQPDVLSGGEIQRIAIARALVHAPTVVLADEPTGALDEQNAQLVVDLLIAQAQRRNAAVVISTHDPEVAKKTDEIVNLRRRQIESLDANVLLSKGGGPS